MRVILTEAELAGLDLQVEGDTFIIRGPREAASLVGRVAERKDELLAVVVFDVVVPDLERLQEIDEPRASELWDLLDHVPLSQ